MGRGNVCTLGKYEGLYYIDNDDFLYGLELWMRDSNVGPGGEIDPCTIDACDADTIVQYALWGELVFG